MNSKTKKTLLIILSTLVVFMFVYAILDFIFFANMRLDKVWRDRLNTLSSLIVLDQYKTVANSNPPNHDPINGDRGRIDDIYAAAEFKINAKLGDVSLQVENNLLKQGYTLSEELQVSDLGQIDEAVQGFYNKDDYIIVKYTFIDKICTGKRCQNLDSDWLRLEKPTSLLKSELINNVRVELMSKNHYLGQFNGVIYDDFIEIESEK